MSQLFISHSEEDKEVAIAIAEALAQRGFGVWYYERHTLPGLPYLDQIFDAIEKCQAVILIISHVSLDSYQVNAEVRMAFDTHKAFVPVLSGITQDEFHAKRKGGWRMALAAATSIMVPPAGASAIIDLLESGVKMLGVTPALPPQPAPAPSRWPAPPVEPTRGAPKDKVVCTLFAPSEFVADNTYLLQVWLHAAEQLTEVTERARAVDADAQPRAEKTVPGGLERGERLRFTIQAGGLPVECLYGMDLAWDGSPVAADFAVEIPPGEASMTVGRAFLFREDVPLASLAFRILIKAEASPVKEPAPPEQSYIQYRKAYISYASEDRAEVLQRAQVLEQTGVSVSMDIMSMKPGESWDEQLHRRIDEADVFFLFWSEAAANSQWVRREVAYALERSRSSPDGRPKIVPVVLSVNAPPPPDSLRELHFDDKFLYLVEAHKAVKE